MQLLVDKYDAPVDAKDKGGETPLHLAAWNNNILAVMFLLSKNASTSIRNNVVSE